MTERKQKPPRAQRAAARSASPADAAAGDRFATRVFRSGNSDALRVPRRFGLAGKDMVVRVLPGDRLLAEPVAKRAWPAGFFERLRVTPDFAPPPIPPASAAAEARGAALFDDAEGG